MTTTTSMSGNGPFSLRATTPNLSILKSIEDLDSFMTESGNKELNEKFLTMVREFNQTNSKSTSSSSAQMNKTQRGFSLSQILAQSLQNGDKQMLETALCVSSAQHAKVLQVSLMRLPAPMVLPLLEAITKRITLKPRRALHLLPWLKNLLLCHAAYLSTIPAASKLLAPLQQSIEDRLVALNPMQKLAGRLELVLKQAELRETTRVLDSEEYSEEPLAVYDESEPETETEFSSEEEDEEDSLQNEMEIDAEESETASEEESYNEEEEDDEESFDEDEDLEDDYE